MFAYKDIFAKPLKTQAHEGRKGPGPELALARLSASIIPYLLRFEKCFYKFLPCNLYYLVLK